MACCAERGSVWDGCAAVTRGVDEDMIPFRQRIPTQRRRLRDIVRKEQARLRAGYWIVVVARPAAANASYRELKDEWLRLAERASILAP